MTRSILWREERCVVVWWSQAYIAPEKPAEASTEESEHLPVIDILGLFSITLHKELRIPDPA